MRTIRSRAAAIATAAVLPLALTACGGGGDDDAGSEGTEEMTDGEDMTDDMSEDMTDEMSEDMTEEG